MEEEYAKLLSWLDRPHLPNLRSDNVSLLNACHRCISQHPQLCTDSQLRDLPGNTVDGLAPYLSGRELLNLSKLFEDLDLDTTDCWRRFIDVTYGHRLLLKRCDLHFSTASYSYNHLLYRSNYNRYMHKFLFTLCQEMINAINNCAVKVNMVNEKYKLMFKEALLLCLPFVETLSVKTLEGLYQPLFEQTRQLMYKSVSTLNLPASISKSLACNVNDFLIHGNVRTVISAVSGNAFHDLLNLLIDLDKDVSVGNHLLTSCTLGKNNEPVDTVSTSSSPEMPADCYCDKSNALDGDLFDDALTCQDFQEQSELEKIDSEITNKLPCQFSQQQDDAIEETICGQTCEDGRYGSQTTKKGVESLIFRLFKDTVSLDNIDMLNKLIQSLSIVKLNFTIEAFSAPIVEPLWRRILVKIGCRQLSHLSLDFLPRYTCHPDKDMVSILLDVLFKYYREEDAYQPMELLHFRMYGLASSTCTVVSYPWNVNAVKQLHLRDMEFSGVCTKNVLHFLQKNTCLTHLTLTYVVFHFPDTLDSSGRNSTFGWLRHLTCLQSLQLKSCSHFELLGKVNRAELTKTLLTLKSLRNLKLEDLYIPGAFVVDADFLTAVRRLDQLSLSENDLGASGAVLLNKLLCSGPTALTSISLSGCRIPGEALLTHPVKNFPRKQTARPRGGFLLKFLNLNNNNITRQQQRELFQHLSPLVKVVFIDIHDGYHQEYVAQM